MVLQEKSQVKGPGYTAKLFNVRYDGIVIRGRYYMPSQRKDNNPTVILSHEFGLNMMSTGRYAKRLAKAGYCTFIYDFSGSGSGTSQGRPSTEMSVITEKEDLEKVFEFVSEQKFVDKDNIILAGASQGGFVSALFASENAEKVKALVMYYPALCIPDDARSGCMLGTSFDPNNIPNEMTIMKYVKIGRKYVEDALALDPWNEICTYSKPVLIIHGTGDNMVNIRYSRVAAKKYPNCRLVEIENAEHCFPSVSSTIKAVNETKKFLEEIEKYE